MPWLRLDDVGYDDPLVRAVGNAAYGAHVRISLYASAHRTDGWVPTSKAREIASRAELRALTTIRVGETGPLLHSPGDDCPCLADVSWPPEQGGYRVHAFLDRNPSKSENQVHRAKTRELKDKELRHAVKTRDGDRCRYCGGTVKWADRKSEAGGVLDHVDPKVASGADNLVVACRGCNGRKKDCTPEAAGMTLRPAPAPDTPPDQTHAGPTPDPPPTHAGSTDQTQIRPQTGSAPDALPDHTADHAPDAAPAATAQAAAPGAGTHAATSDATRDGMTAGTGRGRAGADTSLDPPRTHHAGDAGPTGRRPTTGPPTTPRNQLTPNPYLRSPNPNPMTQPPGPRGGLPT